MADIILQVATADRPIPTKNDINQWVKLALAGQKKGDVTIRFVDMAEMTHLNLNYRGLDRPTNVLSFPFDELPLGDIVICPQVILKEAQDQGKNPIHHFAHMIIHGCLHLSGFTHEAKQKAVKMESLEIAILELLDITNPYLT